MITCFFYLTQELIYFKYKEYLNDLWKYSYLNDEWAMIDEGSDYGVYEGENLRPGGRAYSSFWVEEDPDYIWVFGGRGCDANQCSDGIVF